MPIAGLSRLSKWSRDSRTTSLCGISVGRGFDEFFFPVQFHFSCSLIGHRSLNGIRMHSPTFYLVMACYELRFRSLMPNNVPADTFCLRCFSCMFSLRLPRHRRRSDYCR